jgi:hypothetical protein
MGTSPEGFFPEATAVKPWYGVHCLMMSRSKAPDIAPAVPANLLDFYGHFFL